MKRLRAYGPEFSFSFAVLHGMMETRTAGIGTKAQQALKLQQEQGRQARQSRARAGREAEAQRRFALRAAKRREKHRGH